jgi:WD40 repeat protein
MADDTRREQCPDEHLADTRAVPTRGLEFGDYELLDEIARGGMGVVYRARQTALNRVVALKMILAGELATDGAVRRFRAEAEAAAALDHPHIVPIYEVGERQGQQYFSMKLIEGSSLDRQLDRYRADPRAAVRLLARVARAVQHAHERGILHRDLKPGNVLIDAAGEPHVTDFGLAKRVKEDGQASQSMSIVGTASYMAPEQAQSQGPLTVAADVYALGAILYELLTGRPPFKAGSYIDTLIQVVESEPEPPRSLNPRADRDLEKIALKCLQKQPGRRYAAAGELAAELENWLAGEPLTVRPARGWERFRRWCRKYPLRAGLVLLTAGVLVTAAAGATWFAWHMAAARAEIAAARDEAVRNAEREGAARAEAARERDRNRQLLAGQYVANGAGLLDAGDRFGALLWFGEALALEKGDPAAEEPHRVRLAAVLRRSPRLLHMWFPDDRLALARLSPDGTLVLTVANGQARLFAAATGKEVGPPLPPLGGVRHAAFSPDGRRLILTGADKTARPVDPATRKPLGKPLRHDGEITYAAFGGDSLRVITVGADRAARVWDASTGEPLSPPLAHGADVFLACLGPDGKQAATAGVHPKTGNGQLLLWDVATGKVLGAAATPQFMKQIAFTADGKHLLTLNQQGVVRARRPETGLPLLPGVRGRVQGDDENWLNSQKNYVLSAENRTGVPWDVFAGQPAPFTLPHRADVAYAAFGGNGKWVLTAALDQTARVWDVEDGQPRTPPLRHGRRVVSASFSWDGQKLLTCTEDKVLRLWDIYPQPTDVSPLVFKQPNQFRAISPDGRRMLLGAKAALRLTEIGQKKPAVVNLPHNGPVTHGAFSPDGRRVLYVDQQSATVCDLKGIPLGPPLALAGKLRQAVFAPDGGRVALAEEGGRVRIWDPGRGEVVATHTLLKAAAGVLAVGPRGERLAELGSKQDVVVFDPATHKPALRALKHDTAVVAVAFSPDGRHLATACADGTARVWDLTTAVPVTPPLTHGRPVRRLAFSPDGRRLATAAGDGLVRVWETATGHPVTPFLRHGPVPTHLSFGPDGDRLVTADRGSLRVWDLSPDGRPAADLVRLMHLLTGQQPHATGETLIPVGRDQLRQLWEGRGSP